MAAFFRKISINFDDRVRKSLTYSLAVIQKTLLKSLLDKKFEKRNEDPPNLLRY